MTGRVVILNGTSSAGKSTLALELQDRFVAEGECWIILGIDDFLPRIPRPWLRYGDHVGLHAEDGLSFDAENGHRVGPIGLALAAVYRAAVVAAARHDLNVIVDEVLLEHAWHRAWCEELAGIDVRWVRVECALDVLEQRERDRGDRLLGMARTQYDLVHRYPAYDVTVDTGVLDAGAAADALFSALRR